MRLTIYGPEELWTDAVDVVAAYREEVLSRKKGKQHGLPITHQATAGPGFNGPKIQFLVWHLFDGMAVEVMRCI